MNNKLVHPAPFLLTTWTARAYGLGKVATILLDKLISSPFPPNMITWMFYNSVFLLFLLLIIPE